MPLGVRVGRGVCLREVVGIDHEFAGTCGGEVAERAVEQGRIAERDERFGKVPREGTQAGSETSSEEKGAHHEKGPLIPVRTFPAKENPRGFTAAAEPVPGA